MFMKCNSFEGECQLLRALPCGLLGSGKEKGEKDGVQGVTPRLRLGWDLYLKFGAKSVACGINLPP